MEIDDPKAMAALLRTTREVLVGRVQPALRGHAKLDSAMIANALGLVVRSLEDPGATWAGHASLHADVEALRQQIRRRLAVANPVYIEQVKDAPP